MWDLGEKMAAIPREPLPCAISRKAPNHPCTGAETEAEGSCCHAAQGPWLGSSVLDQELVPLSPLQVASLHW